MRYDQELPHDFGISGTWLHLHDFDPISVGSVCGPFPTLQPLIAGFTVPIPLEIKG